MIRLIGVLLLIFILTIIFGKPIRNYMYNFVSKYADKLAKEKTEDIKRKAKIQDEIMSPRLESEERAKQIQIALNKAGFYKGEIDGKLGPQTEKAVRAFQKSNGLEPDGIVGPKTWEKLSRYLNN